MDGPVQEVKPRAARRIVSLGSLVLVASCAVGPAYRTPPILRGDAPVPPLIGASEPAFDRLAPLPSHWWRLYDDAVLDALVEKALVRNADLRTAVATLEQLQASLAAAESKLWPKTSLSAMGSRGKLSLDGSQSISAVALDSYSLTETISYDLDLFGKLRASIDESRATVEAIAAAVDLARVSIASQVATTYSQACAAGESIALAELSIRLAQTKLDVTRKQFEAGTTDANAVVKSETQLHTTASDLPTYITQQKSALFMLATLTGDPPEAFPATITACAHPPILRDPIAVGDGADLIARRPDVRAAERKLAGSVADIGVSTADLYPSFSIGALGGRIASSIDGRTTTKINVYAFGPEISWTFPNIGAARAAIEQSNASARSSLATFDGTVLTALRETETALVKLARLLDAEAELAAARDGAELSGRNTGYKYATGVGKIEDVLSAYQSLLQAETSLANTRAQASQQQVTLFKALGGGWQDAPRVVETSLESVTTPGRIRWRWSKPAERDDR